MRIGLLVADSEEELLTGSGEERVCIVSIEHVSTGAIMYTLIRPLNYIFGHWGFGLRGSMLVRGLDQEGLRLDSSTV